jgi:NADPH2:quinone reductase
VKAIRVHQFGGPDVLRLEGVPDPTPGPGEVLVRLHAAGVNPADTYVRAGAYALKPSLPYTPGTEGAGVIDALGPDVIDLAVGQRVWLSAATAGRMQGFYAERCAAAARHVHALPDTLSFEQGAAINIAFVTAYRALFDRGQVKPGEIVLIHGATGGVGLAAVQIAARHGAIVLGTGGTVEGRQLAERHGAAKTFDHRQPAYRDAITAATGGHGVDVVIEMLANVNLDKDLGLLAHGGRVVVVGNRGRVEIDARQTMAKESTVTGVTYWGGGDAAVMAALAAVEAGVNAGTYVPFVGQAFPLEQAARAHEAVMAGDGARGKIVLTM